MNGMALALGLIVAIGAQNAFLLRQALRREHVGALVVFCSVADLALIAAGTLGMSQLLMGSPAASQALGWGGALFLAIYGARALRRACQPHAAMQAAQGTGPQSLRAALAQAAAFTLLNPHTYLDTALIGSVGAQQPVGLQGWFIAGAAAGSVSWFTALGYGARRLAPLFARPRAWQVLDALIGLTMWTLAAMLARQALAA